jgi:hypothetical protein
LLDNKGGAIGFSETVTPASDSVQGNTAKANLPATTKHTETTISQLSIDANTKVLSKAGKSLSKNTAIQKAIPTRVELADEGIAHDNTTLQIL